MYTLQDLDRIKKELEEDLNGEHEPDQSTAVEIIQLAIQLAEECKQWQIRWSESNPEVGF